MWRFTRATRVPFCGALGVIQRELAVGQMEQLHGVRSTDLGTIRVADRSLIEPLGCGRHLLERVINGVEDAVGANLKHDSQATHNWKSGSQRSRSVLPARSFLAGAPSRT